MQEYVSSVKTLLRVAAGRNLDQAIHSKDSPLSRQISYGVLRNFYYLSACLEQLLSKPLAEKHQDLELLLMAGIYSINHLNRPPHASVNFAVESTGALKKQWAKKLVNGVLRNYQRQKAAIDQKLENDDEARTNHPEWLLALIKAAYPNSYQEVVLANQSEPPMTLRVNLGRLSRGDYLDRLNTADMVAAAGRLSEASVYLQQPVPVEQLPGFKEGDISIQDEASQLVVTLLNLKSGLRVLDACAAPGGKTCAILEMEPALNLTAIDHDSKRTERIQENLSRLGLTADVQSVSLIDYTPGVKFDRILLDVPCSATGIIRRHPDIKLLRQEEDIAKLTATQEELLAKAWSLLSDNGELVYSTCSILPGENRDVVSRFVEQTPDATFLPITVERLPDNAELMASGLQLLPRDQGTDGFFFSRLKKSSP